MHIRCVGVYLAYVSRTWIGSVLVIAGWENMAREISDSGFMRARRAKNINFDVSPFMREKGVSGGRGVLHRDDDGIPIKVDIFLFKSIRGRMRDKIARDIDRYPVQMLN